MNVGILGTGNLAVALGRAWASAGHAILVTGRDPENASRAAGEISDAAHPVAPADFPSRVDVVVVAIAWEGLDDAISLVGGADGSLNDMTVIDCTNAVDYATGQLKPTSGSAAERVARVAHGAHVVKALHLFAGASWPFSGPQDSAPVVPICGDQADALERTRQLVADLGGRTAHLGGLTSARQLEETAGFVMRVVAVGANPRLAVPDVDPALLNAEPVTAS